MNLLYNYKWALISFLLIMVSFSPSFGFPHIAGCSLPFEFGITISHTNKWITDTTDTIYGKVVDTNNQPIAGVSIRIKGSTIGTITDANGKFSLSDAKNNSILLVSRVGYKPMEKEVHGKSRIVIQLAPKVNKLKGITVNTGYQKVPRERATGSFTFLDNEELNRQTGSNILDRIKGIAGSVSFPGKNISGAPQLMIRGLSTINGPKEPLIVVDNFPYEGNLKDINPNDVKSITILKDAAAASIWGVRAGNGVIVITTKKGQYNEPLQIHFNSNVTITGKPNLDNIQTISSSDYIDVERFLFKKGFYDAALKNTYLYPALSPVVEVLAQQRAGHLSSKEAEAQINSYRNTDIRNQYSKYIYRKGVTQRYALNLQGGSKRFSYYLSGGYDRSINNLSSKNRRYTFRSWNKFSPVKRLEVKLGIKYTQAETKSGKPNFGSILVGSRHIPYLRLADEKGTPLSIATDLRKSYTDTAGGGRLLDWNYYPLTDWKHQTGKGKRQDIALDLGVNYKLPFGFALGFKYRYERQSHETRNLSDIKSYHARDLINRFTQIDNATGIVKHNLPLGGILRLIDEATTGQNLRGQLNFNHQFGVHRIDAFVGAEVRQRSYESHSNINYGYDANTLTTAKVDYVNTFPRYITGNYTPLPVQRGSLDGKLNRFVSLYANAAWAMKGKYILSGSARKDASNLYGVTSNNKWNLLWSSGAAWIISNEKWYKKTGLPYLKLRATYGFSGNTDPGRTALLTFRAKNSSSDLPGNYIVSALKNLPNPSLRWETVRTINMGIDFQAKDQVVSGSIEAYFKKGLNLYGPEEIDPTAGVGMRNSIIKNVANMKGKGVDITINSQNINKRFKWESHLIFSYNASKITKYFVDTSLKSGRLLNNGTRLSPLPGKPVYSIVALKWAGLNAKGEPQGYLGKKKSTDYIGMYFTTRRENLVYKPVIPRYFGSLINDFSYDRFTLSVCINYRLGYYFMKTPMSYETLFNYGAVVGTADYAKRWQKQGDESYTDVPPMVYPVNRYRDYFYGTSMANVLRAGNIRLQYVSLSCHFDKDNTSWLPFGQLDLYANASDLGYLRIFNKERLNPDYTGPIPGKSVTVGLKIKF